MSYKKERREYSHIDLQLLDKRISRLLLLLFFFFLIRAFAGLEEERILPGFFSSREKECMFALPEFLIGH